MFDDYLQTQYTFDPRSNLEYRIAKYSLDGSYNGISDVFNGKLQLCSDASPRLNAAYVFGTYYTQSVSNTIVSMITQPAIYRIIHVVYLL